MQGFHWDTSQASQHPVVFILQRSGHCARFPLGYLSGLTASCSGLLASKRSERAQSCSCSIEISDMYIYICMYVAVRQVIAHARWYVMWEGLSVNHFLKHSNHVK